MARVVHIIGAGLAGLSAAVQLTLHGIQVVIHEATRQAGGRCRSYDDAETGLHIDNGTHLVLSGNHAAVDYLKTLGVTPDFAPADFRFVDGATGESWVLRLGAGRLPWWIFDSSRRVPNTSIADYLNLARLLLSSKDRPLQEIVDVRSELFRRFLNPLIIAALNSDARSGSSKLAAQVARETLLRGGRACRPFVFQKGLSAVFVDPAVEFLKRRGVDIRLEHELESISYCNGRITSLKFTDGEIPLANDDAVIVAVPAAATRAVLPGITTPDRFHAIVNVHYDFAPPAGTPFMTGVINRTVEWIFAFPSRISATVSHADRLLALPRQDIAQTIWKDITAILDIDIAMPKWQLVRERRATFAATPEQNAKRPGARTRWHNLVLAGDWTDTGLPATIEGAIRSGVAGAKVLRET